MIKLGLIAEFVRVVAASDPSQSSSSAPPSSEDCRSVCTSSDRSARTDDSLKTNDTCSTRKTTSTIVSRVSSLFSVASSTGSGSIKSRDETFIGSFFNRTKKPTQDEISRTLFALAEHGGDPANLQQILESTNIDVNVKNENGMAALFVACRDGHLELVKELLKHPNIDVNTSKLSSGSSALYIACQNHHLEIVRLLLARDDIHVNTQKGSGDTPLMMAVKRDHMMLAQELLAHPKIEVNKTKDGGVTPMFLACYYGHLRIVKLLYPKIMMNVRTDTRKTLLHTAAQRAHVEIVEFLFERAPHLAKEEDDKQQTPLAIVEKEKKTLERWLKRCTSEDESKRRNSMEKMKERFQDSQHDGPEDEIVKYDAIIAILKSAN